MKGSYKKYNTGGPVKPKKKKRKKEFTDRTEFLNRLGAYNDSLYAANTSEAMEAYIDKTLPNLHKFSYPGDEDYGTSEAVSYNPTASDKTYPLSSRPSEKPYDVNIDYIEENFVYPSLYDTYFGDNQLSTNSTSKPLSYQNYQLKNPQIPIRKISYTPTDRILSDENYSFKDDGSITKSTYKEGDNKDWYRLEQDIFKHRYDNAYVSPANTFGRDFDVQIFQQPNVEPVYTGEPNEFSEKKELESIKTLNKKPVYTRRPEEAMVDLPSKLPFIKMDLNSMPRIPLRNPLPTIYSRKLNQQSQEYIYDTSHGEIRKKVGQEDATFYNILRSQMEQMRANR
tara:strand:- start:7250 stop:8266 length:1017 start_codon:yes stop_codon:yes gene_type:complete